MSEEQKRKISIALKGHPVSAEARAKIGAFFKGKHPVHEFKVGDPAPRTAFKKNHVPWNLGKKLGPSWNKGIPHRPESKRKNRLAHLGRRHSLETRLRQSKVHLARREKHWAWRDGMASRRVRLRHSLRYRLWREAVFKRDNHTCVECGARSGNGKAVYLEADHIKPWAYFPRLRFKVENGRTLCKPCHKKTPTYKARATKLYAKSRKTRR